VISQSFELNDPRRSVGASARISFLGRIKILQLPLKSTGFAPAKNASAQFYKKEIAAEWKWIRLFRRADVAAKKRGDVAASFLNWRIRSAQFPR
jgi:hypothetical protein